MTKSRLTLLAMFLVLMTGSVWAQSGSGAQSGGSGQSSTAGNSAPDNQTAPSSENPPISGLDRPAWQTPLPSRSFLIPGFHLSESVDSNVGETSGNSSVQGVTRAMGSLMLQKIGGRSMTALDYVGGVAVYTGFTPSTNQIHQVDGEQRILWRRGALTFRDQFSYLPEGSFGFGVYGESGAYNQGLTGIGYMGGGIGTGLGGIFGSEEFGSLGQQPRITNQTVVDVSEALTPRSTLTAAGSYGLIHFTDNTSGFIDSNQIGAQVGYDYQLNRRDQIAVLYGFQEFRYPDFVGSSFTTHVVNLVYGHRVSHRMELILGAGPQITVINSPVPGGTTNKISLSAQASLMYHFSRTTVGIFYDRYNTSGSGYFLGASSDIVRFSLTRPLTRVWTAGADIGYSHNGLIQPGVFGLLPSNTSSFQYLYAGAVVSRPLGRYFGLFVSYQFNYLTFGSSACLPSQPCSQPTQRHVASIGLDWHHPIRLD